MRPGPARLGAARAGTGLCKKRRAGRQSGRQAARTREALQAPAEGGALRPVLESGRPGRGGRAPAWDWRGRAWKRRRRRGGVLLKSEGPI